MKKKVKIVTRGSLLALTQTRMVMGKFQELFPQFVFEELIVKTTGDIKQGTAEAATLDKRAWIDGLESALVSGEADIAIHSAKDLPAELQVGTEVLTVMPREVANDIFIGRFDSTLQRRVQLHEVTSGGVIGTASLRRKASLLSLRPDLKVEPHRGNVPTRIKKLDESSLDGIILAAAGVTRLSLPEAECELLAIDHFVPAPAQGILAAQFVSSNHVAREVCEALTVESVESVFIAERSFSSALGGGCQSAVGAHALVKDGRVSLHGVVLSRDGSTKVEQIVTGVMTETFSLGKNLAAELINAGAKKLLG